MAASFVRFEDGSKSPGSRPLSTKHSPSTAELDNLVVGDLSGYIGPARPALALARPAAHDKGARSSRSLSDHTRTPSEIEMSESPTPGLLETTAVSQAWNNPSINKWRILSACLVYFANGMNDSAPGALLPYIEQYYQVNYAVVSTIFVANAIGFILAAFFVHAIDSKFGRAKTMMFCEACIIAGYTMMTIPPPFPAFVVGFFISGFGMAVGLALNNVFAANTEPSSTVLGTVHGSYGIGGLIAPIIATAAVSKGVLFSRIYSILLAIRVVNFVFTGWAFWSFERDSPRPERSLLAEQENTAVHNRYRQPKQTSSKTRELGEALKNRTTLLGALYIFAYQGAEVSISGWVISFLIKYRDGDPAQVGYVTAGFWGGITLGRFCLTPFSLRFGEKLFPTVLLVLTIVFQLLVWLVPNVVASAVSTAILGLLLGPIYPCVTRVFSKLLDRRMQNSTLAFISSAGSSGGAIAPFLTGVLAQQRGTWVLSPICIGLYSLMLACWGVLTWGYERKRHD